MLRPAVKADIPFFLDVQDRPDSLATIGANDAEGWGGLLADPDCHVLVWESDAGPAGYALLNTPAFDRTRVELRRLALADPGRGGAKAMFPELFDHVFGPMGGLRLWLNVATDNLRAQRVYERAGFQREGHLRAHWLRRTGDRSDLFVDGMLKAERPERP